MKLRHFIYIRRRTTTVSSIGHQMTEIYCFIDDFLKTHPPCASWRRSPNSEPVFTDAEVLTVAVLQSSFGCATLKKAYLLVRENWRGAFPRLVSYKQWVARLHALAEVVGRLLRAVALDLAEADNFYLLDSKPLPVCHPIRHGRVRLLREDGAYFGKSTKGWFFGFKLHLLIAERGHILAAVLTPGNWGDREPALALCLATEGGAALADMGYAGADFAGNLNEETEVLLLTVADGGPRRSARRALLSSVRERIETSFSQLWGRFIDRVYSRSWGGLWNTVKLKMLHYNLVHAGVLSA
jgi:transposase